MREPVTKTSRSETFSSCFEVWPSRVPANEVEAKMLAARRIVGDTRISVFTTKSYTERVASAISMILANLYVVCRRGRRQLQPRHLSRAVARDNLASVLSEL